MDPKQEQLSPRTIAAASGVGDEPAFGAIAPPLYLSTSFAFLGLDQPRAYDYTRSGNPTRAQLAILAPARSV